MWMASWEDADNIPLFRLGMGRRVCPAKPRHIIFFEKRELDGETSTRMKKREGLGKVFPVGREQRSRQASCFPPNPIGKVWICRKSPSRTS
jgi:hypothetical protein